MVYGLDLARRDYNRNLSKRDEQIIEENHISSLSNDAILEKNKDLSSTLAKRCVGVSIIHVYVNILCRTLINYKRYIYIHVYFNCVNRLKISLLDISELLSDYYIYRWLFFKTPQVTIKFIENFLHILLKCFIIVVKFQISYNEWKTLNNTVVMLG